MECPHWDHERPCWGVVEAVDYYPDTGEQIIACEGHQYFHLMPPANVYKTMTDQRLAPELPHRDDCACDCHRLAQYWAVDDGECGNPPDYGPQCCYGWPGSPRRPPRPTCDGCEASDVRLHEVEGIMLCRHCRRLLRTSRPAT